MSVSRRNFFQTVGASSAVLSAEFIIGRGREAMAFESAALQPPDDGGFIRINSNENARGPGRSTIAALQSGISPRGSRSGPCGTLRFTPRPTPPPTMSRRAGCSSPGKAARPSGW